MDDSSKLLEMATAYQRSVIVAAACVTGVAEAIAHRALDAEEVAAELSLNAAGVFALLGALTSLGLAERVGEERFRLSAAGAPLDPGHPRSVSAIVVREWKSYELWGGVPDTVRDGRARAPSWRARLRDDQEGTLASLAALDDLGAISDGALARLAGLNVAGRLLDVGGGSGVHSAALMAATPGLMSTVLDLEPVGELVRRRHPEVAFVAGDIALPRFGLPEPAPWDAVLLADVLREGTRQAARRMIHEAAGLLRSGGMLVVYEPLIDETHDGPVAATMAAMTAMLESEGASAYRSSEIHEWMSEAGMAFVETRRGDGPMAVVRAWRP